MLSESLPNVPWGQKCHQLKPAEESKDETLRTDLLLSRSCETEVLAHSRDVSNGPALAQPASLEGLK